MTAMLAAKHDNFVDLMRWRADLHPEKIALTFFADGETETASLTYRQIDEKARAVAALLQAQGISGQRVLLLFPPSLEFLVSLIGCMYAGAVAVPAYPPEPHRLEHTLRRLQNIVADAQCENLLTTAEISGFAEALFSQMPHSQLQDLQWMTVEEADAFAPEQWDAPTLNQRSLAFLQYTSGSTSAPKGVQVHHGALLANMRMSQEAYGLREQEEVKASWLPQYHDMGLVGLLLGTLHTGGRFLFMPPHAFIKKPLRWLQMISKYRVTMTASPNFGYELCLRKITPEQRDTLDLSSLRALVNGAEPVAPSTCERFIQYFAPAGLQRQAFAPSYGLAEVVVFVSTSDQRQRPQYLSVNKAALEQHRIEECASGDDDALMLTSSGQGWGESQIRIVDPETCRLSPANTIGEIWVSGPHVTGGYWQNPEATERSFCARITDQDEGPFLRTGDLGFLRDGELFVTGRLQDLIIIRGRNLYPHDIERTMDTVRFQHPEIRIGCSAAFSAPIEGEEQLIVFQEIDTQKLDEEQETSETIAALRQAIIEAHDIAPHAVFLLERGSLPKTSSGKIMHKACQQAFLNDFVDSGITLLAVQHGLRSDTSELYASEQEAIQEEASNPQAKENIEWIVGWIANQTGLPPIKISPDADFPSFGLDSVDAIQFLGDLEDRLDRILPTSVLWDYKTVRALAHHLVEA